jgi:hypothetical protein
VISYISHDPHPSLFQLWECEDFLRTWDAETPGGSAPQTHLLNGIAIIMESKVHKSLSGDGSTIVYSYRYLPSVDISDDLHVSH